MGWTDVLKKVADKATDALSDVNADVGLMAAMAACIEGAATRHALDPSAEWKPGEPLKLLLAGYTGSRNTGADVRVEEMVRQFRHILGDDHLQMSVLTMDPELTRGYFKTVHQVLLPRFFPKFLMDLAREHHGVVACEGSMFKSKFANALSTMMTGALGLASAENKLSIAYGGEAGKMDPMLERLVRRYGRTSKIIARNDHSVDVLGRLGIAAERGTDTAWTYDPGNGGRAVLEKLGWDGHTPILAVCPINAFWWPVKPDLAKGAAYATTGAYERDHYSAFYFHHGGKEVDRKQQAYIDGLAEGVRQFTAERDVFVVCVGMEQLDRSACEALNDALGGGCGILVSDEHDMYEMGSAIRQARWMVSSRYHAIVTSMSAGVLSVGVTMDERIPNLMGDRGQPTLALRVDSPTLGAEVADRLRFVEDNEADVRHGIERCVVECLEMMGWMGARVAHFVKERHPEFPLRDGIGDPSRPWDHLPPLSPAIADLVARHRPLQRTA